MNVFLKCVTASIAVIAFSGTAHAALSDQYLQGGGNVLEDDSGEYVFGFRDFDGDPLTADTFNVIVGAPQIGDVFAGFLDIPIINGVNIDSQGNEFTGLFLSVLTNITDSGTSSAVGSTIPDDPYDSATFTFSTAGATLWNAVFGVDLVALGAGVGADLTDTFAIFYEDSANNLDLFVQDFATTIENIVDGDFVLATGGSLDFSTDGTFVQSTDSPLDNTEFNPLINSQRVAGVTELGDFSVNNAVLYEGFDSIDIISHVIGSGTNLVTDLQYHPVQDDTQFAFNAVPVPEPASLALMGLGLLGMSATRKYRRA